MWTVGAHEVVAGSGAGAETLGTQRLQPESGVGINVTQHRDAFGEVTTVTT